jgi:F0F1-type ATP synthase assembly protein I
MQQTTASSKTPSPTTGTKNTPESGPSKLFISMAIDMSWRLALVVLIPIIAGAELDKMQHSSPLWLVVGFVVAMCGVAYVMWRTVQLANVATSEMDFTSEATKNVKTKRKKK